MSVGCYPSLGGLADDVVHVQEVTTDPLDAYCNDVPEADECRVYEE